MLERFSRCCCDGQCFACSGDAPDTFRVVLSGIVNGTFCTDCPDFDGTYDVPISPDFNEGSCLYELEFDSPCSAGDARLVVVPSHLNSPDKSRIQVWIEQSSGGARGITWAKETDGHYGFNCADFASENIPWEGNGATDDCDGSGSTCELTAL